MQFSIMQTEVCQQANLDITDGTAVSNVKRWLNMTQEDICGRWPWEFLKGREVIQTVADKTAGTVSVASGGTAITGVGTAFASTDVGSFIQFETTLDWYQISAYTGATSITIEAPFVGTDSLSGGTYIIRKFFYSLSSSADSIIDMRNWATPIKLGQLDPRFLDEVIPNPQSTGPARNYIVYGYDSSGNIQISPYPFASDVRNIEIRTLKRPTDMSADTDIGIIPVKWHHILIYGALYNAWMYKKNPQMAAVWKNEYEAKIQDMIRKERTSEDSMSVIRSIDEYDSTQWLRLPDGYPTLR